MSDLDPFIFFLQYTQAISTLGLGSSMLGEMFLSVLVPVINEEEGTSVEPESIEREHNGG